MARKFAQAFVLAIACSACWAAVEEVASVAVGADGGNSLLAVRKAIHRAVQRADADSEADEAVHKDLPAGLENLDHSHLICHSTSCLEVHAQLKVLAQRAEATKVKLEDCGKHRRKLEEDLQAAAAARAKAEQELQECADDRADLMKKLDECGKKRTAAEAGLAKCGRERAALEAELKQCAEVDRPNAEKALKECGEERAALEEKLAEVSKKLASGGDSRRRRRRKGSSLLEETTTLDDEHAQLTADIAGLVQKGESLSNDLIALEKKLSDGMEAIQEVDDRIDAHAERLLYTFEDERATLDKADAVHVRLEAGQRAMISELGNLKGATKDLHRSAEAELDAKTEVLQDVSERATAVSALLQLNAEAQQLKHQELALAHEESRKKLVELQSSLAKHLAKGEEEECDETRSKIVAEEAEMAKTQSALKKCLDAKKVLSDKIEQADAAFKAAKLGLEECVRKKSSLQAALDECHRRRDAAKDKLAACLERKSVLKVKIEACHEARDEARKKLKECLARKDELKKKIEAALKKMKAGLVQVSDLGSAHYESLMGLQNVVDDFARDTATFREGIEAENEVHERLSGLIAEIHEDSDLEQTQFAELAASDAEEQADAIRFEEVEGLIGSVQGSLQAAEHRDLEAAEVAEKSLQAIEEVGITVPEPAASKEEGPTGSYSA